MLLKLPKIEVDFYCKGFDKTKSAFCSWYWWLPDFSF